MTLERLECARIWFYVGLVDWTLAKHWAMTEPDDVITTHIKYHTGWRNRIAQETTCSANTLSR